MFYLKLPVRWWIERQPWQFQIKYTNTTDGGCLPQFTQTALICGESCFNKNNQ
jgi:hypothetical protein